MLPLEAMLPFFSRRHDGDLVLGRISSLPFSPKISLSADLRQLHMFITGLTGVGKSFFIGNLVVQDILSGQGVCLLDPHGDLAKQVVTRLISEGFFENEANHKRLIYVAPRRREYAIPMNVLLRPTPTMENNDISQGVIDAFVRADPENLRVGTRFRQIMRNALPVLIDAGETLLSLNRLLTDDDFRNEKLEQIQDPLSRYNAHQFFKGEFDKWGRERFVMINSVTNKADALRGNPSLAYMLGQKTNHLNPRQIMDSGISVIVDMSGCDSETKKLFLNFIVSGFYRAALSRAELPPEARKQYSLIVDEWQSLIVHLGQAQAFAEMLSQVRKYALSLILSNQSVAALGPGLQIAIENAQNILSFRISRADAEVLAKKLSRVDTQRIKNDPNNPNQHPQYEPLQNQFEDLVQGLTGQAKRQATLKLANGKQAMMWTETVNEIKCTWQQQESMIKTLLKLHGTRLKDVHKVLMQQSQPEQSEEGASDPDSLS